LTTDFSKGIGGADPPLLLGEVSFFLLAIIMVIVATGGGAAAAGATVAAASEAAAATTATAGVAAAGGAAAGAAAAVVAPVLPWTGPVLPVVAPVLPWLGPPGWILFGVGAAITVGAEPRQGGVTYDCWKRVLRDETTELSAGITLEQLLTDPRVEGLCKMEEFTAVVRNVWGESFSLTPVQLPTQDWALHAMALEDC